MEEDAVRPLSRAAWGAVLASLAVLGAARTRATGLSFPTRQSTPFSPTAPDSCM